MKKMVMETKIKKMKRKSMKNRRFFINIIIVKVRAQESLNKTICFKQILISSCFVIHKKHLFSLV